jgi:N-acetylneuraminic acid mutarotase
MPNITPRLAALCFFGAMLVDLTPARAANWVTNPAMPTPTRFPSVAAIDGVIYVAGGISSASLSILQAYDPVHKSWASLASLPGATYQADGADVINGQLYIAGGWAAGVPSDNLWIYDPPSNGWIIGPSLPHLSACGAAGAIRGKLYVTTACNGFSGWTNLLDVYDPVAGAWTSLPTSGSAHATPGFGVINDRLYIAGGLGGTGVPTNVTEMFDPLTNTWTTLAPMPTPVQAPASVALNGQLYIFGGSGASAVTTVQVYNPATNKWKTYSKPLPNAAYAAGATVDYGIVFVEAGGDTDGNSLATNLSLEITPTIP